MTTETTKDANNKGPVANGTAFDVEAFSLNIARMVEKGGKALAAYMKPRETGELTDRTAEDISEIVKTFVSVAEYWISDPQRLSDLQTRLGKTYLELWEHASKRLSGEAMDPVITPGPRDRRFADPEWQTNQFFDFLKQAYLLTTKWANELVTDAEGLDPHARRKAAFYVEQIGNALAPSNFVLTNPEVLRQTLTSNAENLVRGMTMLAEDIEAGRGNLRIRQADYSSLVVGRDLAVTPGKVIYQNELMQLIQYEPSTPSVARTPVLIVPPWINKFYILDLRPEKSFIKWCVDQGLTVFVISWVNPGPELAQKTFQDYVQQGPLEALDVIEKVTGEMKSHTVGYCVGGTLLASTLALLAERRQQRITSATLLTAQVDFSKAGDLLVFIDEEQISALEREMKKAGFLHGSSMANTFNMLRSNDLIWSYVVKNYLKGEPPQAFDLLFWNSDSTRMPAANHSFYLRNCYLENRLSNGTMVIDNTTLDLAQVKVPIYNVATREDHIAPADSVLYGAQFFGGPVRSVISGSGHIAGVVNPPSMKKYQYWTNDSAAGGALDEWMKDAVEHAGSWWPDWRSWLAALDNEEIAGRPVGEGSFPPIEEAPGSYVRVKS